MARYAARRTRPGASLDMPGYESLAAPAPRRTSTSIVVAATPLATSAIAAVASVSIALAVPSAIAARTIAAKGIFLRRCRHRRLYLTRCPRRPNGWLNSPPRPIHPRLHRQHYQPWLTLTLAIRQMSFHRHWIALPHGWRMFPILWLPTTSRAKQN